MSLSKCTPFQKVEVSGTLDNNSVLFSAQRMSIAYFYLDLKLQTAQCLPGAATGQSQGPSGAALRVGEELRLGLGWGLKIYLYK